MSKHDDEKDMPDAVERLTYGLDQAVLSQCSYCAHLFDYVPGFSVRCKAFPTGIPGRILRNEASHAEPWYDDDGEPADQGFPLAGSILFTPKPGVPAPVLDALARLLAETEAEIEARYAAASPAERAAADAAAETDY